MPKNLGYFVIFEDDDAKTIKSIKNKLYHKECYALFTYTDTANKKHISKGFDELLEHCEEGDDVYIPNINRIYVYSLNDFLKKISLLLNKNVCVYFIEDENIKFKYNFSPSEILEILKYDEEFRKQKQNKGFQKIKDEGKKLGRKPSPLPPNYKKYIAKWENKEITKTYCMKMLKMKPSTFDRKYKKWKEEQNEKSDK